MGDMDQFVKELKARNVHYFYALDRMQEWQIMFLSNEQMVGTALSGVDRYQPYIDQVTSAYKAGKPIALTAPKWFMNKNITKLMSDEKYEGKICSCDELCAVVNPRKELLQKIKASQQ